MNKQIFVAVIIGLIIGFLAGGMFYKVPENNNFHKMPDGSMMHNEMSNMMAELSGKTGDEFDKVFLKEMIIHHEGAVEMANAALKNSKHEEIKSMSKAIISAQTAEIFQMKSWLKSWYGIN